MMIAQVVKDAGRWVACTALLVCVFSSDLHAQEGCAAIVYHNEISTEGSRTYQLKRVMSFAQCLANRMYRIEPSYGEERKNLQFVVGAWKQQHWVGTASLYFIHLELRWEECNTSKLDSPCTIAYKGVLLVKENGDDPLFLMSEGQEPVMPGYTMRVVELVGSFQDQIREKDSWLADAKYAWSPGHALTY